MLRVAYIPEHFALPLFLALKHQFFKTEVKFVPVIEGTGRLVKLLNDDEVERMVKDAEAHAEEDKRRKEEVEVRNNADALVNATEQTLQELGDKAPADVKAQAEEAIS